MSNLLDYFKNIWEFINKIHPETRTLLIIFLFGYILYSQIADTISQKIYEYNKQEQIYNKKAEKYSMNTAVEINNEVHLIAEKDEEAFDVLLLNYHNNTQSLQGYKYLYLSCLTEAPRLLDTSTLKQQWNRMDYIYYADELAKIHGQSFIQFENIEQVGKVLPKIYRLVKASDAQAVSFFTIEGYDSPIGLIIILYKEYKKYDRQYAQKILPCIQRLAILLDYDQTQK